MSQSLYEFLCECISNDRLQRFEDVLNRRTRHITVVLENVHHGHNASACLRTCDCFGVQDVHVIESLNHFDPNPDVALGASKWLTLHRYTHESSDSSESDDTATATCFEKLRTNGYRILATSPKQHSIALEDVSIDEKTAIVFGSEQLGISDFAISEADELIHIPMFGFTESFNISVSAAIILQQFTARLHAGKHAWKLTELEKQEIREDWVRTSLGNKFAPLRRRFEHQQQHSE